MADALDAAEVLARVSAEPLSLAEVDAFVARAANGATVSFQGVVRDHDRDRTVRALDYRAHPEAERFLRECCERVAERSGLAVAAVHRVGSLVVGDLALVAAVAAPHRREAFEACAELVELVKHEVPIWKRQHFDDGVSEWVGL
ncbi:molybdenum cofactor biosynthesis protein MoaE [Compostimonas suwonensis]|uniref:Molybdopterin synthase catalytic subunit n=1 Tax=Compostimonas suwonensis TaxID=1048394 RepID=A0A2M9BU42_9MICO|nr:molybdenum cofactor biosynthesis protein MoaE [Compostimonas suwonensis]PJJ61441.1 molybdopterin synthase catalytic subunit [Compostimonas suwonensis]